jgi:hypothetical protein
VLGGLAIPIEGICVNSSVGIAPFGPVMKKIRSMINEI